jgi:pilus assembly protein CpaE
VTKILIIDDDLFYHKIIARALSAGKFEVLFAADGKSGIDLARAQHPDLILTDVLMPDIQGYELTRQLRREPAFSQTPILVLTAQTGLQDKLKSFEAGADDYLTKPFEPAELMARVSVLLRRSEAIQVRAPAADCTEKARLIAVHSLRGGAGCSSIAVNLAVSLGALWRSPSLLVDLAMTAGQVALMLNMPLKRTWADIAPYALADLDPELLQSIVSIHETGLAFVSAPTSPVEAESLSAPALEAALGYFAGHYDYIVADLAHDFSELTLQALAMADEIVLVASPDMASVRTLAVALEAYGKLNYPAEKIKLVLNATFPRHGLVKEKIEAALSFPITLTIPYAPDLFVEAINRGQPLVYSKPEEPVAGLLQDLAFYISRESHRKSKPENPSEAWRRVYKRYQQKRS